MPLPLSITKMDVAELTLLIWTSITPLPRIASAAFLSKFYESGSIVFIPQNKFDESIKRGSVVLNDTTTGARIVDDENGNLYSTNATFSQSVSALSSSNNYVGNVFYNVGSLTITETASFDGTNDYTDVTSGDYTLQYKGV